MSTFDPTDPLALDTGLTEEEQALRAVVRRFVTERALPGIAERVEAGTFDRAIAQEMGELGLLGMHLEGYGCAGASAVAYGIACAELEAGDSGLRSFCSVQGSLAMTAIHRFGSEEQRQRWLPSMAQGTAIGCFGLTEPDAGSDPSALRTRARREGDDWILHGTKQWITNGEIADVAVVWAQTEQGVRGFLVEADAPGFSARPVPAKLSLRASVTSELVLDDVRVPDSARLPEAKGLRAPLACLSEARYGIVWGVTGAARTCATAAREHAATRVQFGAPIAAFQLTQKKLVDMSLAVAQGELLALHLGRRKDAEGLAPEHVSAGKLANCRMALDVARTARGVLGASGITLEYPVMRHLTNLESVVTYEGTEEIHTLALGRRLTGHSAFA